MTTAEPLLPSELLDDAPPITDDDLAIYFDVMEMGPNSELRPDGTADPELAAAVERAAHVAGFRIEDDAAAEWAMRLLREADAQLAILREQHEAYLAPINRWHERVTKQPRRTASKMTELLEDYAVRRRDAGGEATVHVPSGTIKTTSSQPAAVVDDDTTVAAWLELRLAQPPAGAEDAGIARWQLWRDAVGALGEPVVVHQPKVYVAPLRKLVTVAEHPVGTVITTTLRCGHTITSTEEVDAEPEHAVGEVLPCPLCPFDPIDGAVTQPVASVEAEPLLELTVLGPDGVPVPGAVVKPGEIKPKVVPGG